MKAKHRPEVLAGRTIRVKSPFGTVYVTLNETVEGAPSELFVNTGKCGSDIAADAEAIGRLCSLLLCLPSTISPVERLRWVVKNLSGIGGSKNVDAGERSIRSVPDALAFALSQYLNDFSLTQRRSAAKAATKT